MPKTSGVASRVRLKSNRVYSENLIDSNLANTVPAA